MNIAAARAHVPSPMADLQARQRQAAERWKARQEEGPRAGQGNGPEDDLDS
jgi:hypothetical protein